MREAYKGYKAFDYLEPGKDYPVYELAKWNWAGEYRVPLKSEAEEKRVEEIVKNNIFIATHEHPVYFPADMTMANTRAYHNAGREFCAYDALAESYIDCVFDNMMDGSCNITSKSGWKWSDVVHDIGMRLCDLHQQDFLIQCKTVADIYRAKKEGKIAWVPVLECATPIENELDRIDVLYGFGVRVMGVTYSESNALGNGLKEECDGGLTKFGKEAVKRMNKVGMLIDCSHCGQKTAADTIRVSEKPIILTHIGARALWNSSRLFGDDVIKACAEKGGVVCAESAPHTTMTSPRNTHDIDTVMEHFEYMANLVGLDHVGFGIDSLYGDHVGLHHAFAASLSTNDVKNKDVEYTEVPFVKGLENPTEASWNIVRWLVSHGYSDADIAKIIGGNVLRVLDQVWVK